MAALSRRETTRRIMSVFLGCTASLIVIFASVHEDFIINVFERKTYDAWMSLRGNLPEREDILIVGITEQDLETIGKWPWPFFITAEVIRALASHDPAALVLDILYKDPEEGLLGDATEEELATAEAARALVEYYKRSQQEMANAIGEAGNIYLAAYLDMSAGEAAPAVSDLDRIENLPLFGPENFSAPDVRSFSERIIRVPDARGYELPLESFRARAAGVGFINAEPDKDGITRMTRLIGRMGQRVLPSLDLTLIAHRLGVPFEDFRIHPGREIEIPARDRVYRIPLTDDGRMRVNFKGPHAYVNKAISVSGFLAAHAGQQAPFSADIVRDKIVLVGMVAEGGTDLRAVPVDPYYPLVAMHATVLDNILGQNPVLTMPGWMRVGLLILTGALIGWALPLVRPSLGFLISLFLFVSTFVVPYLAFRYASYWVPTVQPALTVALAFLQIVFYYFLVEQVQRRHIQEIFGRCVDREVVNRIVDSGLDPQLGGNRANVTVMFADISSFTPYSEAHAAEDVVGRLNEYFTAMTEVIFKYQGTIDKYMGDAIMVFYGNPIPLPDHALRAVRTAVDMQARMKSLQARWGSQGFSQSIGINTGDVVVGWMGAPSKKEYTVIGDTVNTAFRIEGVAKSGQILIGGSTYEIVKEYVEARPLPPIGLKGKSEAQSVYEVLDMKRPVAEESA